MEEAISAVGQYGKYQKIITIISIFIGSIPFILTIAYPYLTKLPAFLCKNENGEYVHCEFNKETFCTGKVDFIKDPKNSVDNFAYDLDLYCGREFFISIYSSLFFFGALLSSVLMAPIPDKYGRKVVFQIFQVFSCIALFNNLFIINPWQLALVFFASGFGTYTYGMSSLINTEYLPRKVGVIVMAICNSSLSIVGIIVGIYFSSVNNKFILFLIFVILQFIMTYLTLRYFKESYIWLYSMKLKNKLIQTLTEIAEINNRLPEFNEYLNNQKNNLKSNSIMNLKQEQKDENEEIPTISFIQIMSFKSQRSNVIKCFICFFILGLTFYGIMLNIAFTRYNFFITCYCCFAGEIFGEIISILSNKYGRVTVMYLNGYIGGGSFLIYTFVDCAILSYVTIFIATSCFASYSNIMFIYAEELFPTPIRAKVFSYCFLMSRLGAMTVGPITNFFGVNTMNFLFAICAIVFGLVIFKMEETLSMPLKNEIPELEKIVSLVEMTKERISISH